MSKELAYLLPSKVSRIYLLECLQFFLSLLLLGYAIHHSVKTSESEAKHLFILDLEYHILNSCCCCCCCFFSFIFLYVGCLQLSWFPFILYDTDWMGREVYHGKPTGSQAEIAAYDQGVRQGAFGLLLNSVRSRKLLQNYLICFHVTAELKIRRSKKKNSRHHRHLFYSFRIYKIRLVSFLLDCSWD